MSENRPRRESFWSRQFGIPDVVREASRLELSLRAAAPGAPYRELAPPGLPSDAQALLTRSAIALALQWACAPVGLFLAVGCRRSARAELEAIAERRSDVSGRKHAVIAYWLAQTVLWLWWGFLAIYVACGLGVALLFATGVVD